MNSLAGGHEPLVSIVTLNYNRPAVTAAFLESTKSLTYRNYEVLVCDMGSTESPLKFFNPSDFPHTRLLFSEKNLGFAGGNNWGIRQSGGEFIFIVNNDTVLTPGIIELMLQPFALDPSIGVVCPKIKYFYHPEIIQYAGFRPMNPYTGRTSTIGDHEPDTGQYDLSGPTNGAHGCAMMVKKQVIEITGMFPEKFFLYYEEWDWSARIRKAGFKIWYQAKATIYHKESQTIGKKNPIIIYYHTRNRILYMRRNSKPFSLVLFSLFFTFLTFPKALFGYIKNGKWKEMKFFLSGIFYNLTHSSYSAQ